MKFYETGETPRKNVDVMTAVGDEIRLSAPAPAADKKDKKKDKKKYKTRSREAEEAAEVGAAPVEEDEVRPCGFVVGGALSADPPRRWCGRVLPLPSSCACLDCVGVCVRVRRPGTQEEQEGEEEEIEERLSHRHGVIYGHCTH